MMFLKKAKSLSRSRDRKATERAFLLAAAKLFAEKGYENTRTLEIAKEAGANEALIPRYFGGKEGLLISILKDDEALVLITSAHEHGCCNELELMPLTVGEGGIRAAILEYFKNAQTLIRARCPYIKIALSRALVDPEVALIVGQKLMGKHLLVMKNQLEQLIRSQKLKTETSQIDQLVMLINSVSFMLNFWMFHVYDIDTKKIDATLELMAEMVERQLTS